jgi:hypothetical protein
MDSKISQEINNNPQGSRLGGPKNRWWNFVQTDIDKLKNYKSERGVKNSADWEKSINL